jgi:arginyl-tRNA--protein-N-Asp/Glu arginylyltransferase
MKYLHWDEQTITDFSPENIASMYDRGYVFTRIGKGVMHQTRSVRINLNEFELSSENRRILKKTDGLCLIDYTLPLKEYDYKIGKLAKDFYDTKFEPGIMSAQKVKEMITDVSKSNFNRLLAFEPIEADRQLGNVICYANDSMLHYSYPFYDLNSSAKDMGLGMMIRAIDHAKKSGMKYFYLGSLQRPGDVYKLQFKGLEWFGGNEWTADIEAAKELLK